MTKLITVWKKKKKIKNKENNVKQNVCQKPLYVKVQDKKKAKVSSFISIRDTINISRI